MVDDISYIVFILGFQNCFLLEECPITKIIVIKLNNRTTHCHNGYKHIPIINNMKITNIEYDT